MYRKDFIPELNGLRGIAVLMVLWVHLPPTALGESLRSLRVALVPGNVGVDLFFVLSGFLITRILLVDRTAGKSLRHFLMRRFLRIFPIYYLLLAGLAVHLQWQEILACATYTSNYAFLIKDTTSLLEHTWSLAVEEHFYLLWPPVVVFLSPLASRRVLLWAVFPLSLLTTLLVLKFGNWESEGELLRELLGRGSTSRFASLGAGALLAYHEGFVRGTGWRPVPFALGLMLLSLLFSRSGLERTGLGQILLQAPIFGGDMERLVPCMTQLKTPLMSLGVLLLAVAQSGQNWPWARLLRAGSLGSIGRISYGLYLYHYPIFSITLGAGANPSTQSVALALGLSFAAATASYWILERPIMKLAARFREPLPG